MWSFRQSDEPLFSFLLLLFCSIGFLVCTGVAIYESIKQTRLAIYGVKTEATCIRFEWRGEGRGRTRVPIFRFTTEAGTTLEVGDIPGGRVAKKTGDVISIVYLPSNPEVVSKPGIEGWGVLLWAIMIGFFLVVFVWHWLR